MNAHPIAAVLIHVADVAAALDWYAQALPDAVRVRSDEPAFECLSLDGVQIELVPADEKVGSGACGAVVYWHTPDFDAALRRLQGIGALLYRGPMRIDGGQRMCQVRDPWGNCIGLRGPSV